MTGAPAETAAEPKITGAGRDPSIRTPAASNTAVISRPRAGYASCMHRVLVGELMDAPDVPPDQLARSLGYIRWINRRLGGVHGLLRHLKPWSRRWPRAEQGRVTLLDIATGSADIPAAARAWALRNGFDLHVTAVDAHHTTLAQARAFLSTQPDEVRAGVAIEHADALRLTDRFADSSFDYVHAGLFLHHLPDVEALTALRIMDRVARRGFVWNDLVRSPLRAALVELIIVGQPNIVRHDARASVRAGFTRDEAEGMVRRVGAPYARWRPGPIYHRFTVAGEKPGAWA